MEKKSYTPKATGIEEPGVQDNIAKRLFIMTNSGESVDGRGEEAPGVWKRAPLARSPASHLEGHLPVRKTLGSSHICLRQCTDGVRVVDVERITPNSH